MSILNRNKRLCIYVGLILFLSTYVSGGPRACDRCRKQPISQVISSLASRLINEIAEDENFIISPLSISAALAMLYMGANGLTKTEMRDALGYNTFRDLNQDVKILEGFRDLIFSLKIENDIMSLLAANSAFIQKNYPVSSYYTEKVQNYFDSEVNYVDFANEEEKTMKTINQWVSEKTQHQIKKLLNEPLDTLTRMILANVIYFNGLWEHSFSDTWNSLFHYNNGSTVAVPFMKLNENLTFFQDVDYSFLELPYTGGNVSMLLILPKNTRDKPKFDLTPEALCGIRSKLEEQNVFVGLPRVQLGYRRELSEDMKKFGMTKLFSERADLTGISETNELRVSLMIHKAVIEIDEKGSRASAISGIGVDSRKKSPHTSMFWANHPFQFYIIDKRMETILFAGRVMTP